MDVMDGVDLSSSSISSSVAILTDQMMSTVSSTSTSISSDMSDNPIIAAIMSSMSDNRYMFMLPVATLVATSCQLAGIGGAALFGPIFLLLFPPLGLSLPSPAASVASALLTEVFGFASGLLGYSRRGLVDWNTAGTTMAISVPAALIGAEGAGYLAAVDPVYLRSAYATLMLGLCAFLLLAPRPDAILDEECDIPSDGSADDFPEILSKTTADGTTTYNYLRPTVTPQSVLATIGGGSLTGLLGVGIGEVVLPQLVRVSCMPVPLAAGTSVAVVVVTALTAAAVQFVELAGSVGGEGQSFAAGLAEVVPWSLVRFTIPGVLLGGQIAPYLNSRGAFRDEDIERFAAGLFGIVGTAFAVKALVG